MSKQNIILFFIVTVLSAIVYAVTVCPTVEFIDSGELALACKHLGIAHPTGYPLYTMLGNLASRFPAGELINRVNFLSLLFAALAAGFLYLFIERALREERAHRATNRVAASTALFVGLSPIWWAQGTTNEVYSLNLLLITVSLWALFKFSLQSEPVWRWLMFSLYFLGMCLANHLSAIYLIPGYAYVTIAALRRTRITVQGFIIALVFFFLPLTLYLFLPIRAQFAPFLNWGGVDDPYFLYKHISGWQYRVWMFTNPLGVLENLPGRMGPALSLIYDQLKWYGLIAVLAGLVWSLFRSRKFFFFALLIWAVNLIYVLNYEIGDIETYYLPMILVTSVFMAMALGLLYERADERGWVWLTHAASVLLILFPAGNLLLNLEDCDRNRKEFARQGVEDIGQSVGLGGVALMENWDFYSPWLYFRFEEKFRPDMTLLDKELMRRSWYIDFIRRYHPEIYGRSQAEFEEFLRQVQPFERGRPFDPAIIDAAYYGMLDAVIAHESVLGPVYTNVTTDAKFLAGRGLVPDGIMFRFDRPEIFLVRPNFIFDDAVWSDRSVARDLRVSYLLSFYLRTFEGRQKYCAYFERAEEAAYYQRLAARVRGIMVEIEGRAG